MSIDRLSGGVEVHVRPLFYDALSGEFTAPSDPLGRTHTLGRLMVATCEKGVYDSLTDVHAAHMPNGLGRRNRSHVYQPSWARATVRAVKTQEDLRNSSYIEGLVLRSIDTEDTLGIYEYKPDPAADERKLRIVTTDALNISLNLEEIETARWAVTEAAQAFFDGLAVPVS